MLRWLGGQPGWSWTGVGDLGAAEAGGWQLHAPCGAGGASDSAMNQGSCHNLPVMELSLHEQQNTCIDASMVLHVRMFRTPLGVPLVLLQTRSATLAALSMIFGSKKGTVLTTTQRSLSAVMHAASALQGGFMSPCRPGAKNQNTWQNPRLRPSLTKCRPRLPFLAALRTQPQCTPAPPVWLGSAVTAASGWLCGARAAG